MKKIMMANEYSPDERWRSFIMPATFALAILLVQLAVSLELADRGTLTWFDRRKKIDT
jgi:SNF family Na+-dependent transporter